MTTTKPIKLPTRARVYAYIQQFWCEYNYPPTLLEIARALDLNSVSAVRYHVRELRHEGKIAWTEGADRTIHLAGASTNGASTKAMQIPKAVYLELLSGLDELDEAYGKTAESVNARNWLLGAVKAQPLALGAAQPPAATEGDKANE